MLRVRANNIFVVFLMGLMITLFASKASAEQRWDLLTIESIKCVKPAGGVDGWIIDGLNALKEIAGVGKEVGPIIGQPEVSAVADAAAKGSSKAKKALEFLDGKFSGQDDLIIQVNGKTVFPETGTYKAMKAGETIYPNIQASFRDKVRISLIEYDSGSDNDDLGNVTIDTSTMKIGETHQWKELIIIAPSSEDGSTYLITARVSAGKGNKDAVPGWVKCGTAQCIACPKAMCAERDSSELDRDGDKPDLKACPPGYRDFSFQKYPQTWPAADVYLRICMLDTDYSLMFKHSGRCMDVWGRSRDNHAKLQQYDCHYGENQAVKLIPNGSGYLSLQFIHSGRCMDVWGRSRDNHAKLQQYDCHSGDNQLVSLGSKENGYYEIKFKHSNKCVDVRGRSRDNHAELQQYDCHGGNNQLLELKRH